MPVLGPRGGVPHACYSPRKRLSWRISTMAVQPAQTLDLTLRPAAPDDAQVCGQICYAAFDAISSQHNFPHDFPSSDVAVGLLSYLTTHPRVYGVVAERDGRVVGSNFLDERSSIAGVGPI